MANRAIIEDSQKKKNLKKGTWFKSGKGIFTNIVVYKQNLAMRTFI